MAVSGDGARTSFACEQCGAMLSFDGVRTQTCPYCASPNIVRRAASRDQPEPQFAIPFTGDVAWARRRLATWLGRRTVFADSALRRRRRDAEHGNDELRGVYVPAYVYSALARTDYTAQIGEHYTDTETYTKTEPNGERKTETREVTRTEHRALSGPHVGYVTDVVVSASSGLTNVELARVEPFDLRGLHRFAPSLISGWITEEFARDPETCRRLSRAEAVNAVGDRLRRFMPGDSYSDLAWQTRIEWESLDPILIPVWVFAVRYRGDRAPLRVVINGQTGRATGKTPLVWWKIAIAVVIAATAIVAVYWLSRGGQP